MGCCRRRQREIEEEIEAVEDISDEETETESFCNSSCFLIVWRDSDGRRRCKCCRRGCNA